LPINVAVIVPGNETVALTNAFAQDTLKLTPTLDLTFGIKFEYSTFSGFQPLPNVRLAWQEDESSLWWAAISRAVETPSRLDRDLVIPPIFGPSPQFTSEKLIAYEAGNRRQISQEASLSVSVFYNQYSDVRTTSPGGPFFDFQNGLEGHTYGVELWGDYRPLPWWRLSAGASLLRKSLDLKPGTVDFAGAQTAAGIDPGHQLFLRSYMQVSDSVMLYVALRQIGALPLAGVSDYVEADARIGWAVTPSLELSLTGQNLVHAHHAEATDGFGNNFSIPRSILVGLRKSF
jgi:iron complex outermembrane recepter protein